jgi:gliding motility-associated-like protein
MHHHPRLFLVALAHLGIGATAMGQSACAFSLGPDTVLCNGQLMFLTAPQGALSWNWNDGTQSILLGAETSGTYSCTAFFPITGDELVVDGDFSLNAGSFTTDLVPGMGGSFGLLSTEGTYAVVSNGTLAHNNFAPCDDHTTGTGNMLVVNGSASPGANIWCQTVSVQPNTFYAFSAWVVTMVSEAPAEMRFAINGVDLGAPLLAALATCQWDQFYALWNSGSATTATICINNQNLATSGNDFALDDISFAALCSWTDSVEVTILPPAPTLVLGPDAPLCPDSSATLQATLVPAGWPLNDMQYSWSTGGTTDTEVVTGPGTYTATASGRCLNATASVTLLEDTCILPVPPIEPGTLAMPNVFTPNGDGVNDVFGPILTGKRPSNYSLEIRNRWGQLLFSSSRPDEVWDGRYEGMKLPAATYFWVARYTLTTPEGTQQAYDQSGHLTLLDAR